MAWEDTTFAVPCYSSRDLLLESLGRNGILHPPWVWDEPGGKYVIVDGFTRLRWARESGAESLPCTVFGRRTPRERLVCLRIEEKLLGSPLNPAEKARLVALLGEISPVEKDFPRLLSALGISGRREIVEAWRRLDSAGAELLEAAASGGICERAALELARWDPGSAREVLGWFRVLRCSASIQVEVLDRIGEIAAREKREKLDLLKDPAWGSILGSSHWNHREKTRELRNLLARRRFPRLHARMDRFRRDLAGLSLPESLQLVPPRDFEGDRWELRLGFSTESDLARGAKAAQGLAESGKLDEVLHPDRFAGSP